MSEAGSWESIRQLGLHSTTALLELFEIEGDQRQQLEARHRPASVPIEHPDHGRAVLRDQKPMSDRGLVRCLEDDLTPEDWYRILNRKVFFWATRDRLETHLGARAYRDRQHTVLTIDTAELVAACGDRIYLTTMNTGSTVFVPHPRGTRTFIPLDEFDYEASRRKRGRNRAIAEVVVDYAVPDVEDYAVRVEEIGGGRTSEVIFER